MDYSQRVYTNDGNAAVLSMISSKARTVLDVGCGAGDNAQRLKHRDPHKTVDGITASEAEAELCRPHMRNCWKVDVEQPLPSELANRRYDAIVCSNVLEHLRDPAAVVARLAALLETNGELIIAVPNVLFWRFRLLFLSGRFEYASGGTMDETHLRFYTYETADRYLLASAPTLKLTEKRVVSSVPFWGARRYLPNLALRLDRLGGTLRPNLFGGEVLLRAEKK